MSAAIQNGLNAVVTGANRGLGLELCRQLCQDERYKTIFALCRKASNELTSLASSEKIVVVDKVDVTQDDCEAALLAAIPKTTAIDLLVHNAGAYGPPEKVSDPNEIYKTQTLLNVTPERMRYAFELNAVGPLRITQALLPNLKVEPGDACRKVVIITSAMGSIADNGSGGHYGYRSAKAAVNMIGKSLAVDLKDDNIAVGMVHPGFVHTGFGRGADQETTEKRPGQRDADDSVKGILDAVESITLENSGCFLHGNYGEGVKSMPW